MSELTFEKKEENFIKLIEESAQSLGKRFFVDSGEGHDFETDILYCEDISGWLIPNDKADEFIKSKNRHNSEWNEFYVFEEWSKVENSIKIGFRKYPIYEMK